MTVVDQWRPETAAGGFTRDDEAIEFYTRVNALVEPDMVVVDLGAGRGSRFDHGSAPFRKWFCNFHGRVRKVIGIDVDPVVMTHPHLDEARVIEPGGRLPLEDASVDIIICEWVIEHVEHPRQFAQEIHRVLKPGGWLCALTPNRLGYVGIGTTLVPETVKDRMMRLVWPERPREDAFPTFYRMNTLAAFGAPSTKRAGRTMATCRTARRNITAGPPQALPSFLCCNGSCRRPCAPTFLCSRASIRGQSAPNLGFRRPTGDRAEHRSKGFDGIAPSRRSARQTASQSLNSSSNANRQFLIVAADNAIALRALSPDFPGNAAGTRTCDGG